MNTMECIICLQTINQLVGKLECNHSFCFSCIELWNKKNKSCPLCRMDIIKISQSKRMHTGYIESCHDPKPNVDWYISSKYDSDFIENLKNGKFIPCGNSGSIPWIAPIEDTGSGKNLLSTFNTNGITNSFFKKASGKMKIECCCFCFGKSCCIEMKLIRRWTCCKEKEGLYTLQEILDIPGCSFINT